MTHLILIGLVRQADPAHRLPEWEEVAAVAGGVQNIQLTLAAGPGCGCYWSSLAWSRAWLESGEARQVCGLARWDPAQIPM